MTEMEISEKEIVSALSLSWGFGDEATKVKREAGWSVVTQLKDGEILAGGQKLELQLSEETSVIIGGGQIDGVFRIEKMTVDERAVDMKFETYVWPQPPLPPDPLKSEWIKSEPAKPLVDFLCTMGNAYADPSTQRIIMEQIQTADGLAFYFHEEGHLTGASNIVGTEKFDEIKTLLRDSPGEPITDDVRGELEAIFQEVSRQRCL